MSTTASITNTPGYFKRYIDQVEETDLMTALRNQAAMLEPFLGSITEEKSAYAYAEGKWTIKELLQHIIDCERIFGYRALCFARGEKTNLPGFEEDDYAANSNANNRSWQSLVAEFFTARKSIELMYESFSEDALNNTGLANNNALNAAAIGFILVGHFNHHKKIMEERYL